MRVVTSVGPTGNWLMLHGKRTFAGLAADYLRTQGLDGVKEIAVSVPASAKNRTFLSAVEVHD